MRNFGPWTSLNHALVMLVREAKCREGSSTASVIDRQSAKTTQTGGICGYDSAKKLKGFGSCLTKNFERAIKSATAWLIIASVQIITRTVSMA
jgi:transposase